MKKQTHFKKPKNLPDYPSREKVIQLLEDDTVVVSDKVMRRFFGISWLEYKKKYRGY